MISGLSAITLIIGIYCFFIGFDKNNKLIHRFGLIATLFSIIGLFL